MDLTRSLQTCETHFDQYLEDLKSLVRIPSVSFEGFDPGEVRRSAKAVAELMKKRGLEKVEIREVEGAHPYVYGERCRAPGAPTLLLYAHHDVQPPGREEMWKTPPFEPTLKEGPGGMRMYARGAADDKAGILVHLAAIGSILESGEELPVNVKLIVEGEEETGSEHLAQFLKKYRSRLDADVLVLTDTTNFDCGIPSLTIALRGMVGLDLEVRALSKAVHSGMWGGPLPDPAAALCKMLATLTDERGRIAVPEIVKEISALSAEDEAELKRIPFEEGKFRDQSGLVPGAEILAEGPSPYGQTWSFPSLTINALQASSRKQAGNIINDAAWGRVSVRLVPGMDPERVLAALRKHLEAAIPWGLEVKFSVDACAAGWKTEPRGPAFDAARVAMEKGYGRAPLMIGCGGSIPFVQPFSDALGGAPALLIGVEDPYTNAHGENESVLVDDLKKACLSQIHLFGELAARLRQK